MELARLQHQLVSFTNTLFKEGILDEQYKQIQILRDENVPCFANELFSQFFGDTDKAILELTNALGQTGFEDFKGMNFIAHQLKGGSSSIGAEKVTDAVVAFRQCCLDSNVEGCQTSLQQLKVEYSVLKNRLEFILALENQILAAGGSLPPLDA